ncbi:MAG: hypothetical protein IT440_04035 [Phycisphaeraceae bacterium]|nr:hypothetical protein [Phycisphaeraceae bacterium]
MPYALVSDAEKEQVWKAYREGKPTRVPVTIGTTPRVVSMNPAINPDNLDLALAAQDPKMHVELALQFQRYFRRVISKYCDFSTDWPDHWDINLNVDSVYDAACLGAEVDYTPGHIPDAKPFLTDDNKWDIFKLDISDPVKCDFLQDRLAFWREMEKICKDLKFEGKPVVLHPYAHIWLDGPVTVSCNIRGATEFLTDLAADPEYADKLMRFVVDAAINRRESFIRYWDGKVGRPPVMGDDSCMMLSVEMYRQQVLPHHKRWYDSTPTEAPRKRFIHLCGDATRLFPTMHKELDIWSFDTGFPVNHGQLRRVLGPEVEISGGPEVALLLSATPEQVYRRVTDILKSGVMEGGKFVLKEGNNLPPCVPEANLEAMYTACLEHGRYA